MQPLSISDQQAVNGGGIPLFIGVLLGAIALASFVNGCNDSQTDDCYYTDGDGNECPCGS